MFKLNCEQNQINLRLYLGHIVFDRVDRKEPNFFLKFLMLAVPWIAWDALKSSIDSNLENSWMI